MSSEDLAPVKRRDFPDARLMKNALTLMGKQGRAGRRCSLAPGLPVDQDPWGPSLVEDSSFAWGRPCSGALLGGKQGRYTAQQPLQVPN